MAVSRSYGADAMKIIEHRLNERRDLTFEQVSSLPEVSGEDIVIDGTKARVTIFRQSSPYELSGRVLLTVLIARPRWFGMAAHHIERGLVFSPDQPVREATESELQNSGG